MSGPARRKVYLDFVGCRLNQAEIERLGRRFAAQGDSIVERAEDADLVIVNTCAVTNEAMRKSRQMLRQAGRANPDARLIATGCYAELSPDQLAALPGVRQVVGNRDKDDLIQIAGHSAAPDFDQEPIARDPLPPGTLGRTRAFVKVQDGCDNRCTFCVTTIARGAGYSVPVEEVVREVWGLVAFGYREAVLTGVHLGSYGHDLVEGPVSLFDLVKALLERTSIARLRLSSLEPWDIQPGFFDLWQDERLCPHLHLPLQAGSDRTLRRMARRTTQDSFRRLIDAARARIPDLTLTTDVIVGFPGESEADFEESIRFVEAMGFARLHVFPYSARPGTAAAGFAGQVEKTEKDERRARMLALSAQLWERHQRRYLGHTLSVLWESARGGTPEGLIWSGLTGNYLRVQATSRQPLANKITDARLTQIAGSGILAVPLTQ
ncbi:MAG: tRNA (N(6)-L-threonylcarbamoyladenosine(37)-C(2))-methylthiotransferase MtaB [Chloroflexota bacterium]|jgi:threonylcarbamoyladenosine tRNA methylthiotransferase MtaB